MDKGVAFQIFRFWFWKLLDIGDREKTFFLILLFVIRHDLEGTPFQVLIAIVIQRLKSTQFCEGTKIEFDIAVQLKKVHQPFTQLPMAQRIGSVPISVLEMT